MSAPFRILRALADRATTPLRRVAVALATSALVIAVAVPVANAAETPAVKLAVLDDLVIASGKHFPVSTEIEIVAKITRGQGKATVKSKADGRFLVAFTTPEDFTGLVEVIATSGSVGAKVTVTVPADTAPTTTAAPSTTVTTVAPTTTTIGTPATTAPITTTTIKPSGSLVYGPLLPLGGVLKSGSSLTTDISKAPLAPNSSAVVAELATQVSTRYNGIAAFNNSDFSASTYTVAPNTTRITIKFDDCQNKGYTPWQLYDKAQGAHFVDVPVPAGAVTSTGTDKSMSIYDPATDQFWEFWVMTKKADGWYACWGGRMDKASESSFFPNGMGASATGIPNGLTSVKVRDIQSGSINHAIALQIVEAHTYPTFSWPAQRTDGWNPSNKANIVMEGQRLRLDPSINVDSLGLHPVATKIAKAAQTYGFIITDKAGAVSIVAENGADVAGGNPWGPLLNGTPAYAVLKDFPWDKLQALPKDYGKP